jgi:hypothetical protein
LQRVEANAIIGRQSQFSEQFMNGIKVRMARNYNLRLGEETIKRSTERAGIYP